MYDDLMSRLRNLSCIEIKNGEDVMPITTEAVKCIREIAVDAADAIEELSRELMELKMKTCRCCEVEGELEDERTQRDDKADT